MRVRFSNLRCFFLAMRLRRFLMTEPTVRLSVTAPEAGYREMPGRSRQVPYRNVRRHRDANRWSHPTEREPWTGDDGVELVRLGFPSGPALMVARVSGIKTVQIPDPVVCLQPCRGALVGAGFFLAQSSELRRAQASTAARKAARMALSSSTRRAAAVVPAGDVTRSRSSVAEASTPSSMAAAPANVPFTSFVATSRPRPW